MHWMVACTSSTDWMLSSYLTDGSWQLTAINNLILFDVIVSNNWLMWMLHTTCVFKCVWLTSSIRFEIYWPFIITGHSDEQYGATFSCCRAWPVTVYFNNLVELYNRKKLFAEVDVVYRTVKIWYSVSMMISLYCEKECCLYWCYGYCLSVQIYCYKLFLVTVRWQL